MVKLVNQTKFAAKIKAKKIPIFSVADTQGLFGLSKSAAVKVLYRYAKNGFIIRLKRGLYAFPDTLPPDLFITNKLYEPSYISLQFALSYHGVIPETVYEITSITTKATRRFKVRGKIYTYRRIKRQAFSGYQAERQAGVSFLIADPEKAFVDLLYFRLHSGKKPLSRFSKEKINPAKALRYAELFRNSKLTGIIKTTLR